MYASVTSDQRQFDALDKQCEVATRLNGIHGKGSVAVLPKTGFATIAKVAKDVTKDKSTIRERVCVNVHDLQEFIGSYLCEKIPQFTTQHKKEMYEDYDVNFKEQDGKNYFILWVVLYY